MINPVTPPAAPAVLQGYVPRIFTVADLAPALKVLAEGLASNEHKEFVKHLQPTT